MTADELLISILTKFYNKSEDEVKKAIYTEDGVTLQDNAFDTITTIDTARVTKFKTESKTGFNQGYAKGKEETRKADVAAIKEKLSIESDSDQFDEVLEAGKVQIEEKTKEKVTPLTEDQVKTHPLYLKLEKDRVPKTELDKLKADHEAFVQRIESEKVYGTIDELAIKARDNIKFIDFDRFKDTPGILKTLDRQYLNEFRRYDYKSDGGTGYILLYKEDGFGKNGLPVKKGDRVDDEHGNPMTIDKLAEEYTPNYYPVLKQKPKGSASNKDGDPGDPSKQDPTKPPIFKASKDYTDYVNKLDKSDKDYDKKIVEAGQIYRKGVTEKTIEIVN